MNNGHDIGSTQVGDQLARGEMVESIYRVDPLVIDVIDQCHYCVLYYMEPHNTTPAWTDGHISGGVFLVKRSQEPIYQVILKNILSPGMDLIDAITPQWDLDAQNHFIFYRMDISKEKIRGLWFKDDSDRITFLKSMRTCYDEVIQNTRHFTNEPRPASMKAPPQMPYASRATPSYSVSPQPANDTNTQTLYALFGINDGRPTEESAKTGMKETPKVPHQDDDQVIQLRKRDLHRFIQISCQHLLQNLPPSVLDGIWNQAVNEFPSK